MNERYELGRQQLALLDPGGIDRMADRLGAIAPDIARLIVEFPFGDIYARPGLDLRSRQLATVAALTALGTAAPQLRLHIAGALNVGWAREEIVEVVGDLHTVPLVSLEGSIDWMCVPRFNSPSVVAALLDEEKGGFFRIAPTTDDTTRKQLYWPESNVLVTRFFSEQGAAELIDFMPVEREIETKRGTRHRVIRRVSAVRGRLEMRMVCRQLRPRCSRGRADRGRQALTVDAQAHQLPRPLRPHAARTDRQRPAPPAPNATHRSRLPHGLMTIHHSIRRYGPASSRPTRRGSACGLGAAQQRSERIVSFHTTSCAPLRITAAGCQKLWSAPQSGRRQRGEVCHAWSRPRIDCRYAVHIAGI